MNQYRYNRRMKSTCYQVGSPRAAQRQQLICTQINLTKFQSLKHEIYPELNRRRHSYDSGRLGFRNVSLDSINKTNKEHSFECKILTTYDPSFFPFKNDKISLTSKLQQFGRDCLKQTMLVNKTNHIKQDCFPSICPKKFNPIKIEKLRKRCNKIDAKQQRQPNTNGFICQPWFITQQAYDSNKF